MVQLQAKFRKKQLNTMLLATKLMLTCLKTPFLQGKHPLWSSTFQQNQEMDKKPTGPPKTNMEAENTFLEKEKQLQTTNFCVSC